MYSITTVKGDQAEWHVQDEKPEIEHEILMLGAGGDELELIRTRMPNVPICFGHCIWRGEMAQFIYDNLTPAR